MRYGPLLTVVALLFGGLAAVSISRGWAFGWFFVWPALSFAVVAMGYFWMGPIALGKRRDGTRAPWAYPLAGPFLAAMWLGRQILAAMSRDEPAWNEVAEGIYVGRRTKASALPADVGAVIDLTSEFLPHRCVLVGVRYITLPTLDGSAPRPAVLAAFLDEIGDVEGPLYIHCAAGHGRSAMLAACVLVRRGVAADIDEAMAIMREARPLVKLGGRQAERARAALSLRQ